jgi:hypothetical protein
MALTQGSGEELSKRIGMAWFNDPDYRIILLRVMAWAMNESFDPFHRC